MVSFVKTSSFVCLGVVMLCGCALFENIDNISPEAGDGGMDSNVDTNMKMRSDLDTTSSSVSAPEPGEVGGSCSGENDCRSGLHCENQICCRSGAFCCNENVSCPNNVACNIVSAECHGKCWESAEDDKLCAAGYHCEELIGCQKDKGGGDECDEGSDCASGECLSKHCCEHPGLCCKDNNECPDMFYGCDANDPSWSMTCAFGEFTLPETGQGPDQCYNLLAEKVSCSDYEPGDQYHGQDGHFQVHPRAYQVNGDEVKDIVTGLVWSLGVSDAPMTQMDSLSYCTGGWRLPKRYELQTIVDYGIEAEASWYIDKAFNMPTNNIGAFWTATDVAGSDGAMAWLVNFKFGTVYHGVKTESDAMVRCVK